jgi:hypothetical protein
MLRPRSCFISLVLLVVGFVGGCGGDSEACGPTDASCGNTPPPSAALQVSSVSPADGANHVDSSSTVVVTFSKPVQPTSVTATTFTVGNVSGSISVSGATVTFTPAAPLTAGTNYQVRVQGVRDLAGTAMATVFSSAFTTRTQPECKDCPATSITRDDVQGQGTVVQTAQGFTVNGSMSVKMAAGKQITFVNADLDVRFDESGKLRSISGQVQIPSPHERITFADPIRADVGIFSGRFLNQQRDLGILLKDDTDYFVFDFEKQLSLSIATGETGAGANKPITVRVPGGKRMLMIVDYNDPMYYLYGSQDVIGAAGMGWSLNGRIPFVPKLTVNDLGAFDGRTTRTGTFPVFKIMSVTGQLVDNNTTEVHLAEMDPFTSSVRVDYQSGFNGELALDLFLKEIVGLEIKLASASGGVRRTIDTQTGFSGYAFARGMTARDDSWWPAFIPARPVAELDAQARIESNGNFQVGLSGEFGWELPAGRQSMRGSFDLSNDALTLKGAITDGAVNLNITGVVTVPNTTVSIVPPTELLQGIHDQVNSQVMTQISAAQKAYNDLVAATATYQFEASLRGIRVLIPDIIRVAKAGIDAGIIQGLSSHEGWFYYDALLRLVNDAARPYHARLDAVAAEARKADDAATRALLRSALTALIDNQSISVTVGIPGTFLSYSYSRDILTNTQANYLIQARSYIPFIQPASEHMVTMRQVYDLIPDRLIFEQVRDNVQNGVLVMKPVSQLGFVLPHTPPVTFNAYVVISGTRYEVGSIRALTIAELVAKLLDPMILALRAD